MDERPYRKLLARAEADERVLDVVLTGSRGRGAHVTERSDWDVRLIVRDDAAEDCADAYRSERGAPVETVVHSLAGFAETPEWDRYSYVHAAIVLDRLDGGIAAAVAAKSMPPPGTADAALDAYVNACYRSLKSARKGLRLEAHLVAVESLAPFLTALFGLHGRVRPFNAYLRWELEHFPLPDPWSADELLARLERIAATSHLAAQQALFRDLERVARARGLDRVIDGWEPDLRFLRRAG